MLFLRCLLLLGLTVFCSVFSVTCQSNATLISIVPQPQTVVPGKGSFLLNTNTTLYYPEDAPDWDLPVQYLKAALEPATGYQLPMVRFPYYVTDPQKNALYFVEDPNITEKEGYRLEVRPAYIMIRARNPAGAFYAVQSLRQLLPAATLGDQKNTRSEWKIPCCTIEDAPRFSYRGLHLDVGRHFFPVDFVKRYIDLLAFHKMNVFHWHLTEDQGWRIEIKKFPELQTIAACRNETLVGHYGDDPVLYDGQKYCGFYTQEEVKEVVEYARKRFVTVIPEIEMPGHAQAVLAAFPELGCTGGPYEVMKTWGVTEEVFCAGNDKTFAFIEAVLEEVCALFPGPYVHIGGDECPKERWKKCVKCQRRIQQERLKDEHELQSFFIRKAEKILARHGKKMIGWDEILEGGLAPSATVMSWRGISGGIEAAKQGHDVIMSPTDNCYLDYYQANPENEPLAIGGLLTLEKVYEYEPVPKELNKSEVRYILGVQGNLWTEYIENPAKAEYMAYPRACALAEVAWSDKNNRNWDRFVQRMRVHFSRLDALKVNASQAFYNVSARFENAKITLRSSDPSLTIYYTLDGTEPGPGHGTIYRAPIVLKKSAVLKSAGYAGQRKMGQVFTAHYMIHKAFGKSYRMSVSPDKYKGGETYALTNGINGQMKNWADWVGIVAGNLDPVIDLGEPMPFSAISGQFLNQKSSWIYPPRSVEVLVSDDGQNFRSLGKQTLDATTIPDKSIQSFKVRFEAQKARYLKVLVENFGTIPAGMPGAGNGAWLFLDEIVLE
jgi:hexosaminidase